MKRSIACLLVFIMTVTLLCACTAVQKQTAVDYWQETTPEQIPQPTVPQADMPQADLDAALKQIDLSILCAGLETTRRMQKMAGEYAYVEMTYCGDYDGDGDQEVMTDAADFIFDLSEGRTSQFFMQQGLPVYYTDQEGKVYRLTSMDDIVLEERNGQTVFTSYLYCAYALWQNGAWETVIAYSGEVSAKGDTSVDMYALTDPGKFESYDMSAELYGKEVSMQELADHCDEIGLERIKTLPGAFTTRSYDAAYRDSLETQLQEYFSQQGFAWDRIRRDLDGDGAEESVFILSGFDQLWRNHIQNRNNGFREDGADWMNHLFLPEYTYTGILLVDTQADQVQLRASCTLKSVNISSSDLRLENGFLCWGSDSVYVGGGFVDVNDPQVPANVVKYLADFGYDDCFLRSVDVTDMDGKEYLCFCQKNGAWYVLIIVLETGDPGLVYSSSIANKAVYLTEKDGKECLMIYSQNAFYLSNGVHRTEYAYDLLRFDEKGNTEYVDTANVGYNDDNQDATATAQFFDKLNAYMVKIIVIRDPYALTGSEWMSQEQADYGTVPTEQEEAEKATMGFVQIADPASWLNLREGPGKEYARVLMDPSDPDSFVRQAQGSPVTVLETITTGDPENPVWLKIRIHYGDREIIGYSSKTYIRLADE